MKSATSNGLLLAAAMLTSSVLADPTKIADADMAKYMKSNHSGLAQLNAPVWFFGRSYSDVPCIPTWAYGGLDGPDVYNADHRTPGGARCGFRTETYEQNRVGCNCRNPGGDIGHSTPSFPVYFTVNQCSDTEIRVSHNLFYEKDGFLLGDQVPPFGIDVGHDWDWERIVIIYGKSGNGDSATWQANKALLSQHGGFLELAWGDIQNTLTLDQARSPDPRNPQGSTNQDHPKIYVGWAKHANFDTKNTGWNDPLSQLLNNAFRSDDWWQFVRPENFIEADSSTPAGQVMASQDWGHADSIPPRVQDSMCGVRLLDTARGLNEVDDRELTDTDNGNLMDTSQIPKAIVTTVPASIVSDLQAQVTPTPNSALGGIVV